MIIDFGQHRNTPLEILFFTEPDYVHWMLRETGGTRPGMTPIGRASKEAHRLIAVFDAKPFANRACFGGCGQTVKYRSVLKANYRVQRWWCASCDPYALSVAGPGSLFGVASYGDALRCSWKLPKRSRPRALALIVRTLATGKGLAPRLTPDAASAFFHSGPSARAVAL